MKNVKWLLTVLFIFSICIPSFAGHVPLHGHLKKKQRSVNLDVPIKADTTVQRNFLRHDLN